MKRCHILTLVLVLLLFILPVGVSASPSPQAGAPTVVGYQGQVTVAGTPYSGTGYFKFAIVSPTGSTSYWSNDGTSVDGGQPTAAVPLTVSTGLFSVLLGDTTLMGMTQPLYAYVFAGTDRALRVWFSSNNTTFTQLSPDRRLASVPYALQAEKARGYYKVVVVAQSGGDFTSIQAALDSITDASSYHNYLVWVGPGVYMERVTMKQYVDIEGAGQRTTVIRYENDSGSTGTVVGANDAELRNLRVQATGSSVNYSYAIYNNHAAPRITDVTVEAESSFISCGVMNAYSSPTLTHVTADVRAGGGPNYSYGVCNSTSSPSIIDSNLTATGGRYNYGIYNYLSSPVVVGTTATVSGVGNQNCGIYINASSPTIRHSVLSASGGANNYGVCNFADQTGSFTVKINHSEISGTTNTVYNDSHFTTRIGASQLDGGPVYNPSGGTLTCAGVYDENYVFYASTCP